MESHSNNRIKPSIALAIVGVVIFSLPYLIPRHFYIEALKNNPPGGPLWWMWLLMATLLLGAMMFGGGIGYYFNRKWTGAVCGAAALIVIGLISR